MAINYTKIGWDTTKYVNPTNMNQMDNGIKAACDGVDGISANYIKAAVNAEQVIKNTATNTTIALHIQNMYPVGSANQCFLGFKNANNTDIGYLGIKDSKPYTITDTLHEIALKDDFGFVESGDTKSITTTLFRNNDNTRVIAFAIPTTKTPIVTAVFAPGRTDITSLFNFLNTAGQLFGTTTSTAYDGATLYVLFHF